MEQAELSVRLSVSFTEVGTLELWCESVSSPHRWRLQFQVRAEPEVAPAATDSPPSTLQLTPYKIDTGELTLAEQLIHERFTKRGGGQSPDPKPLVKELESVFSVRRESWPLALVRPLVDALLTHAGGRQLSAAHEARWLNLLGYCLRPGFGEADDHKRFAQLRSIYHAGLSFPRELQCQVDWLVLWRRVAGGLSSTLQNELRTYLASLGVSAKKASARLNPQVEREGWRLLASLEHTASSLRPALGNELLRRLKKEPRESAWLWSLGRLGERIPLYGPLNCVVAPELAAEWVSGLLELRELSPEAASAIVQIGRFTGDRSRDLEAELRARVTAKLRKLSILDESVLRRLQTAAPPDRHEVALSFGEPLPKGLELESSLHCLSPVSALKHQG
ncbi:MAG: hypothetical protein H0X25_10080 [Acidobacteriales bacterium]|nr:hypothetical protein [Terriglobales bacterium]